MNNKINRINHAFAREISKVLEFEVKNQHIKFKQSQHLLWAFQKTDTLKALNQASGFIRTKLFDRIDIRHMPKLEFVYDDSIEYGIDIENKIKEIHKNDGE